jgi:hypothetical protein
MNDGECMLDRGCLRAPSVMQLCSKCGHVIQAGETALFLHKPSAPWFWECAVCGLGVVCGSITESRQQGQLDLFAVVQA